uniref:Uncharacterized protein n=1 Tax=Triticum urartu TaxID=4572 RepID=A0A8R7THI0_TRIUA
LERGEALGRLDDGHRKAEALSDDLLLHLFEFLVKLVFLLLVALVFLALVLPVLVFGLLVLPVEELPPFFALELGRVKHAAGAHHHPGAVLAAAGDEHGALPGLGQAVGEPLVPLAVLGWLQRQVAVPVAVRPHVVEHDKVPRLVQRHVEDEEQHADPGLDLVLVGGCLDDHVGLVDDVLHLGGVEAEVVEHPVEEVEPVLVVRRAHANPEPEREGVLDPVVDEHLLRQRRLAAAVDPGDARRPEQHLILLLPLLADEGVDHIVGFLVPAVYPALIHVARCPLVVLRHGLLSCILIRGRRRRRNIAENGDGLLQQGVDGQLRGSRLERVAVAHRRHRHLLALGLVRLRLLLLGPCLALLQGIADTAQQLGQLLLLPHLRWLRDDLLLVCLEDAEDVVQLRPVRQLTVHFVLERLEQLLHYSLQIIAALLRHDYLS